VIHTVGPVWKGGEEGEEEILRNCYLHSLQLAEKQGFRSVAFPNISTGVYGYPKDKAAKVALDAVKSFESSVIQKIHFICFDDENYRLYQEHLTAS